MLLFFFFSEMKQDTLVQIADFERMLERIMKQDAQDTAAQEAHDKIEAAKEKLFGVKAASKAFEKSGAEKFRMDLSVIM